MAARDLLHRGAEQHHGVGAIQTRLRAESEFALAGPELDLDRAQRQADLLDAMAQQFHRRIEHVVAGFGEILVALRQQADVGRFRRPGRVGRRQTRIRQLEQMELDFQSGNEIEAGLGKRRKRIAAARARGKRHRLGHW